MGHEGRVSQGTFWSEPTRERVKRDTRRSHKAFVTSVTPSKAPPIHLRSWRCWDCGTVQGWSNRRVEFVCEECRSGYAFLTR